MSCHVFLPHVGQCVFSSRPTHHTHTPAQDNTHHKTTPAPRTTHHTHTNGWTRARRATARDLETKKVNAWIRTRSTSDRDPEMRAATVRDPARVILDKNLDHLQ